MDKTLDAIQSILFYSLGVGISTALLIFAFYLKHQYQARERLRRTRNLLERSDSAVEQSRQRRELSNQILNNSYIGLIEQKLMTWIFSQDETEETNNNVDVSKTEIEKESDDIEKQSQMTIHRDDNNDMDEKHEEETNDDTKVLALDKKDNDESLQEEIDNNNNNSKNKNETNETDCTCPICLLDFEPGDTVTRGKECHHTFHQSCIMKWLLSSNSSLIQEGRNENKCPICRKVLICFEEEDLDEKKRTQQAQQQVNDNDDENNNDLLVEIQAVEE